MSTPAELLAQARELEARAASNPMADVHVDDEGMAHFLDDQGRAQRVPWREGQRYVDNFGWSPLSRRDVLEREYADSPVRGFLAGLVEPVAAIRALPQVVAERVMGLPEPQTEEEMMRRRVAMRVAFPGSGGQSAREALEHVSAAQGQNPIAGLAGTITGALIPTGPVGLAGRGATAVTTRVLPKALAESTSLVGRAATKAIPAMIAGSAEAAAIGAPAELARQAGAGEPFDPAKTAEALGTSAAWGGLLSLAGLGVVTGARRLRQGARSKLGIEGNPVKDYLAKADDVGKQLDGVRGEVAAAEAAQNAAFGRIKKWHAAQDAVDRASQRVAGLTDDAARLRAQEAAAKAEWEALAKGGPDVARARPAVDAVNAEARLHQLRAQEARILDEIRRPMAPSSTGREKALEQLKLIRAEMDAHAANLGSPERLVALQAAGRRATDEAALAPKTVVTGAFDRLARVRRGIREAGSAQSPLAAGPTPAVSPAAMRAGPQPRGARLADLLRQQKLLGQRAEAAEQSLKGAKSQLELAQQLAGAAKKDATKASKEMVKGGQLMAKAQAREAQLGARRAELDQVVADLSAKGLDDPARLRLLQKRRDQVQQAMRGVEGSNDPVTKELLKQYKAEHKLLEQTIKDAQATVFSAAAERLGGGMGIGAGLLGGFAFDSVLAGLGIAGGGRLVARLLGNRIAAGAFRAGMRAAPFMGKVTQVASIHLLAPREMRRLENDLGIWASPEELAQVALHGYQQGGLEPAAAQRLAMFQANRVGLLKDVLATGDRLAVSNVLNAVEDPRRITERMKRKRMLNVEDVLVLQRVFPDLYRQMRQAAKRELDENDDLTAEDRRMLMMLASPQQFAGYQKGMQQLVAGQKEQQGPKPQRMGKVATTLYQTNQQRIQQEAQRGIPR